MTQEDKELLLKDLSARLPYGIKCCATYKNCSIKAIRKNSICIEGRRESSTYDGGPSYVEKWVDPSEIKPYLRPLSSMTEEEEKEIRICWNEDWCKGLYPCYPKTIDFYNSHHFDYRSLIEKGLAIAVTEENNPYK